MPSLQRLSKTAPASEHVAALETDGAVIITDALDTSAIEAVVREAEPFIATTPLGKDDFAGKHTQRTGALVARVPACRPLVTDPVVLAAARTFLEPYTDKIILHLTQTIRIHPGAEAQRLHRDRLAWGGYLPAEIEPQFNTIWALSDFTRDNGATRVVPGSQRWPVDRKAAEPEVCCAEMPAGSVLLYSGSVLHAGGANTAHQERLGLNITYCLGWLRTEENQYLSCPPHIARTLEPELQELLGYTQANYALGYYSDPETAEGRYDIVPPEMALGRKPRDRIHREYDLISDQPL